MFCPTIFLHRQHLGSQIGGKAPHEDVWYLDTRYRTAVVHQKEAWAAVTNKLREVFTNVRISTPDVSRIAL